MPDLTILHTNDLHGKMTDRAADIIAREKSAAGRCLLLDAGDAVSSGNVYYRPGGEPVLARMTELGYDAMVMGNREFHFLEAGLKSKVKLARFPILCANIRGKDGKLPPAVKPSASWDLDGLRVACFGLTVPMITKRMKVSRLSPYYFEHPIDIAAEIVPTLRPECDLLIALTHTGFRADMELAESVAGIDLVVGGHSHTVLNEPAMVGDTAIVQTGFWGHYLGKTEITIAGARPEIRTTLIDLRDDS
jgi:2',3'-cyclic-nucleotide 2'-phosphodiesterase (5'-nucleotidase family)